jgi:hypothetical protein
MLRSQHPALYVEQLALHLLRLRVLALVTEEASKIAHRMQCAWMLRSKHPSPHVEQPALHLLRLCACLGHRGSEQDCPS